MKYKKQFINLHQKQQGVALFVSLIMLLILTIIGLSAAKRGNLQERMAGNMHFQNVIFNAAESAIGGFMIEANSGNKADPAHILFGLRVKGSLADMCYNQLGSRVACVGGGVFLDGDRAAQLQSKVTATVIDDCNTSMCSGFSLGQSGGGFGCRIFDVVGTGSIGTRSTSNTLRIYEISACAK